MSNKTTVKEMYKVKTLSKTINGKYVINLGLCAGSEMPVDKFIFEYLLDSLKSWNYMTYMECRTIYEIKNILWEEYEAGDKSALEYSDKSIDDLWLPKDKVHLNLYVTDNPNPYALVSVINTCRLNGIQLSIFHYNTATNKCYPQDVVE